MKTLGIIPARYASSRFPGKPLAKIRGKSMIQRVFQRVNESALMDRVIVATDDARIYDHVKAFGGNVQMTSTDHRSGTDRCAEVFSSMDAAESYDVVFNIQGDEPFIQAGQLAAVRQLFEREECSIGTLCVPIKEPALVEDPNVVKIVFDAHQKALYFSRHPIPFVRNHPRSSWPEHQPYYKHLGLYAFRAATLLEVAELSPSSLELAESLEQLRWLQNGFNIYTGITSQDAYGIDHPEDIERIPNQFFNQ